MDRDRWVAIYRKLMTVYNKPMSASQLETYFAALQEYSSLLVEEAVDVVVASREHWPKVAHIVEAIQAIVAKKRYNAPAVECELCHGDWFVEAPDEEHFGLTYTNYVRRCPQCRPSKAATAASF